MSVAIRAITRLQDGDDAPSLGAGQDGYALTWDNASGAFVATALVTDHGALTGLTDDDHSQYLLATGARTGASSQAQAFTNGIIGPSWKPSADSTTALQMQNAAGTAILTVDTTDRRLRLNAIAANSSLAVQPYNINDSNIELRNYGGTAMAVIGTGSNHCGFVAQTGADFLFQTASSRGFIFKQSSGYIAFRDYQDYEAARVTDAEWAFNYNGNPSFDVRIRSANTNYLFFADGSADKVGIGASSPASRLHVSLEDTATTTISQLLTLGHDSSGTPAAGFGAGLLYQLESSTTAAQDAARIAALWTDATHATRASALTFSTLTAGGSLTERMRIDGAGNVGIGTTAPTYTLEVVGIVASGSASVGGEFRSYQAPIANKNCIGLGTNDGESKSGLVRYLNDTQLGYFLFYDTGTGDTSLNVVFTGAAITMKVANVEKARLSNAGYFGIGTTAPATPLHVVSTTATTNALRNVLTLGANVTDTGVGAAGLGSAILFTAKSTTTVDTQQARIAALWYEATHATFKSDLVGYASDAAGEREIWRGRGNGSAAAIGFLGAAPAARIAHVADPAGGATVDAEARSAINSILATLESFGFHATS